MAAKVVWMAEAMGSEVAGMVAFGVGTRVAVPAAETVVVTMVVIPAGVMVVFWAVAWAAAEQVVGTRAVMPVGVMVVF